MSFSTFRGKGVARPSGLQEPARHMRLCDGRMRMALRPRAVRTLRRRPGLSTGGQSFVTNDGLIRNHTLEKSVEDHDLIVHEELAVHAEGDQNLRPPQSIADALLAVEFTRQSKGVEVFIRAFEIRYRIKISDEGRANFAHLAASGELMKMLKAALAQPMAYLASRFSGVWEMPEYFQKQDLDPAKFILFDILKLNSTMRMRLYSRWTETVELSDGRQVPSQRSLKACFELTQLKNVAPVLTFPELVRSVKDHYDTMTEPSNPRVRLDVEENVNQLAQLVFDDVIRPFSKAGVREPKYRGKATDRAALLERDPVLFQEIQYKQYEDQDAMQKLRSGLGFKFAISDQREAIDLSIAPDELYQISATGEELRGRPSRTDTEEELLSRFFQTVQLSDENRAEVVPLLEPLKVRTISIDSGILRYKASYLQQYMRDSIAKWDIFTLTMGTSVEDATRDMSLDLPYVSGDYKGATDSIFHNITFEWIRQLRARLAIPKGEEAMWDAIFRDFTSVLLDYRKAFELEGTRWLVEFARNIPGHPFEIIDPSKNEGFNDLLRKVDAHLRRWDYEPLELSGLHEILEKPVVRQARGQLMGNVLSFPILCLINLTGYVTALQRFARKVGAAPSSEDLVLLDHLVEHGVARKCRMGYTIQLDRASLRALPVRINGDDILFQASKTFYDVWSETIGDVGFIKSVGKNYFSRHFFTINSQLGIPGIPGTPPTRINHIWWSGLSPDFLRKRNDLTRLLGKDAKISDTRAFLSPVQQTFLDSVGHHRRKAFNELWLENMDEYISAFDTKDFRVSRTLPIPLGGLGLELVSPEPLTYSQKLLAGRLHLDDSHRWTRLGESAISAILARPYAKFYRSKVRTVKIPLVEFQRLLEEGHQVRKFSDLPIRAMTYLTPTWRTPPPDDISFQKSELSAHTDRIFRWAMACSRRLQSKLTSETRPHIPLVEVLSSTVPRSSITQDAGS